MRGFGITGKSVVHKSEGSLSEQVRELRRLGIPEPAMHEDGSPVLTSVWIPTVAQLAEIRTNPFHGSVKFTGRTFPFVVRNLLRLYSTEGSTVYDPMLGSGTTLYEGDRLGRVVMGSDLNENTVASFRSRWKMHNADRPMPRVFRCSADNLEHLWDESVDFVIMSFPWYTTWKFADHTEQSERSLEKASGFDDFVNRGTAVYREVHRALRPGGFAANILGNTFKGGIYYPITSCVPEMLRLVGMSFHYQFWSLRTTADMIAFPWKRSGLDTKIRKAPRGVGWDVHEDIIIGKKP